MGRYVTLAMLWVQTSLHLVKVLPYRPLAQLIRTHIVPFVIWGISWTDNKTFLLSVPATSFILQNIAFVIIHFGPISYNLEIIIACTTMPLHIKIFNKIFTVTVIETCNLYNSLNSFTHLSLNSRIFSRQQKRYFPVEVRSNIEINKIEACGILHYTTNKKFINICCQQLVAELSADNPLMLQCQKCTYKFFTKYF